MWQNQLSNAAQKLVTQLGVSGEHRLYSSEVVDLGGDVSLILMFPPTEQLFCVLGQQDPLLSKPDLITLPIHTFEMVHMSTYQSQLLGRYARLNCILEMDKLVAEHAKREAFSQAEINSTKQRLTQVQSFHEQLEEAWKQLRWVKDAISFARDKASLGVPLSIIIATASPNQYSHLNRSRPSSFTHRNSDSSSPPSSPPFLNTRHAHHNSSDSVHLGADHKRFCKAEHRSNSSNNLRGLKMKKSSTAENVRVTPKADVNFVKSNTSECLFHPVNGDYQQNSSGHSQLRKYSHPSFANNSNEKFIHSPRMYSKNRAVAKSDYHLQDSIEPSFPLPRKASAPPDLDSTSSNQLHLSQSLLPTAMQDSTSMDFLPTPDHVRRRKDTVIESKENALKITNSVRTPSSSCYDLHQQFSSSVKNEMKRTGSSLSHESEGSSVNASPKSISSTETETDTLSLMSRESGRSEASEKQKWLRDGQYQ